MSEEDYKIAYENVMIANKMLEQENKQLKQEKEMWEKLADRLYNEKEMWEKLADRLYNEKEKAIEYIKENCTNYYVEEPHYRGVELLNIEELLEILGGE